MNRPATLHSPSECDADFAADTSTRVRYLIDSTSVVDMPIGPAHGMSAYTMDDNGPWSAGSLFGKTGVGLHEGGASHGSGFFNTYLVPFAATVNVTVGLGRPLLGATCMHT